VPGVLIIADKMLDKKSANAKIKKPFRVLTEL
jgi:hypothetical protein